MTAIIIRLLLFCICYTIPILKTEEEFWNLDEDTPSVNGVRDVPDNFKEWIADNSDRIEKATELGTLPYFIKDNREVVDEVMSGEDKLHKHQLSQEEARNKLNALLEVDKPYANPKLVRMMEGKDFTNNYSILEVSEREVVVQTSVGNVTVNLRHGPTELYENLEMASDRIRRHGYDIELCEKREDGKGADSYNRTLERFEEYKVNDKQTINSIDRNIRDGSHQAGIVVLKVPDTTSLENLREAISNRGRRCRGLEEIIIILNDKEAIFTRKQFVHPNFQIKKEDFK